MVNTIAPPISTENDTMVIDFFKMNCPIDFDCESRSLLIMKDSELARRNQKRSNIKMSESLCLSMKLEMKIISFMLCVCLTVALLFIIFNLLLLLITLIAQGPLRQQSRRSNSYGSPNVFFPNDISLPRCSQGLITLTWLEQAVVQGVYDMKQIVSLLLPYYLHR